jgi:hypothetical protein
MLRRIILIRAMRPELNAKHKIKALERRKALLDALIEFIRTHPNVSSDAVIQPQYNKTGLYVYDTAIIRPLWVKDKVVLRLEKYTEDWAYRDPDYDQFDTSKRTVCEDVSQMSEDDLEAMLDKLDQELHPDED